MGDDSHRISASIVIIIYINCYIYSMHTLFCWSVRRQSKRVFVLFCYLQSQLLCPPHETHTAGVKLFSGSVTCSSWMSVAQCGVAAAASASDGGGGCLLWDLRFCQPFSVARLCDGCDSVAVASCRDLNKEGTEKLASRMRVQTLDYTTMIHIITIRPFSSPSSLYSIIHYTSSAALLLSAAAY